MPRNRVTVHHIRLKSIGTCFTFLLITSLGPAQSSLFGPQRIIDATEFGSARSVFAADLDGDGDDDILAASFFSDKIAWYENTDGMGEFGRQQIIATSADGVQSVFAADLDGDGDQDVLAALFNENKIVWYPNIDGMGVFGPQRVITTLADSAWSVFAADVDGDGDQDVLSASEADNKIAWYENADGKGGFAPQRVITVEAVGARSVFAADLDGDGDQDVLSASYSTVREDSKIAWYENIDGMGGFGPQQVITTLAWSPNSVFATDLDGDGDQDVLSASSFDGKIAWYANTDGLGTFGPQQEITDLAETAQSVTAADLDGDGDQDVLSASSGLTDGIRRVNWYENTNGRGDFGPRQSIATTGTDVWSVFATDLDGDGDQDVISASGGGAKVVAWYRNTDGLGAFGPEQGISNRPGGAFKIIAADLDGDGDQDLLSGSSDGSTAWYDNTDGKGAFGPPRVIAQLTTGNVSIFASDLDGDGDQDVLSASSSNDGKIAWHENTDGRGTFGPPQWITNSSFGVGSVFTADLDGDGDQDVLATVGLQDEVVWYENTDGMGAFGPQQVITESTLGPASVFAADLNGDGNPDVLTASFSDDKIAWYENIDGTGAFGPQQVITELADQAVAVFSADLDDDGDMDVLSASRIGAQIAWYENMDGMGTFGPQQVITTVAFGAAWVYAADLDGDWDVDVLSASFRDNEFAWYENLTPPNSAYSPWVKYR